jgi:hypothetical protein
MQKLTFLLIACTFFDTMKLVPAIMFYIRHADEFSDREEALEELLKQLAIIFARNHWQVVQDVEGYGLADDIGSGRPRSNKWQK